MKISNTPNVARAAPTRPANRAGKTASATNAPAARRIEDTVQVLSIPPEEMTERVQSAIMSLMQEVDSLRQELDHTNRRLREMEDVADTDALLPIPNRRAFVRELNRMISFAERYGTPSTLMFIDLNNMKNVNDKYGHDAGDKVLFHVARLLVDNVRTTDVVGRLGGDEFGVILAQADEKIGAEKANSLADIIAKNTLEVDGEMLSTTMAFGTYTFRSGDKPDDALDKADKAMYENKRDMKSTDDSR